MARTRSIKTDSANAVAKAGTREKGAPSKSAGTWTELRGNRPAGPFRPGKTAAERRGSRS